MKKLQASNFRIVELIIQCIVILLGNKAKITGESLAARQMFFCVNFSSAVLPLIRLLPTHLQKTLPHHFQHLGRTSHCHGFLDRAGFSQFSRSANSEFLQSPLLDGADYHGTFCFTGSQESYIISCQIIT